MKKVIISVLTTFGCLASIYGLAKASAVLPEEAMPPITAPPEAPPEKVEHKFPEDMIVQKLNYGWIGYSPSMAKEGYGAFYLQYTAPGIGYTLYSVVVGQPIIYGVYPASVTEASYKLEEYANKQIKGFQYFIDMLEKGYCIGECVNGTVFVYETCEKVVEACELWQGGFRRFLNDPAYWESRKQPYYKILDDAKAIRSFIEKYT